MTRWQLFLVSEYATHWRAPLFFPVWDFLDALYVTVCMVRHATAMASLCPVALHSIVAGWSGLA